MAGGAIPKSIIADIKRLIRELKKEQVFIERAILFGSYAQGMAHQYSDIDVALVSKDFSGIRFNDNQRLIKPILRINRTIETHPYTPQDFVDSPFVRDEILKHGIEIHQDN